MTTRKPKVFRQTSNLVENQILVYGRDGGGSLKKVQ